MVERGERERKSNERETEMVTETKMATKGGRISLPLAVGVDRDDSQAAGFGSRPPPFAKSLFLFFLSFLPEKSSEVDGGWRHLSGVPLFGCLIECLVLILNLYIFLEILRCQLVSDEQKTIPLYHDCIAIATQRNKPLWGST
jgi:hypothetical protein